jgi:hypothetical protein
MVTPTGNKSEAGFSRREIIAFAGAARAAGVVRVDTLPDDAHARGRSAFPPPRRRKAIRIQGSTSAVPVAGGAHPLEPLSADEISQAFVLIEGDPRFPSARCSRSCS